MAGSAASVSGKWQATRWPGNSSRGSGTSSAQRSAARGQRVRNRQPDGGLTGDGGSPRSVVVARPAPGSVDGIESSSALRVRVQRLLVDRLARPDLAELPEVHHPDPVADLLDEGEVVRDEQVGEAELAAELLEQVEHLRLDQHVERGDRLVADQQVGLERDGARDRDPLRLPARQLPRVPLGVPGRVEADQVEQLVDPLPARLPVARRVGDQRLLDDRPDLPLRVERSERVLEHELHVLPRGQQPAAAQPGQLAAAEADGARLRTRRLQDRPGEGRLARPGLADDAERLARHDVERDAGDRLDDAAAGAAALADDELLDQIADRQQRLLLLGRRLGAH